MIVFLLEKKLLPVAVFWRGFYGIVEIEFE